MKPRALIVEDDPSVMPSVEDVLFSMGHGHSWVTNQHDAQQTLASEKVDYVLLDLVEFWEQIKRISARRITTRQRPPASPS